MSNYQQTARIEKEIMDLMKIWLECQMAADSDLTKHGLAQQLDAHFSLPFQFSLEKIYKRAQKEEE